MESCNARRRVGSHWRKSRGEVSSSLFKKRGKSHHNSNGSKSKQKAPKAAPPPPKEGDENTPDPTVFDVLDFGAKGDGSTDDTKVKINANIT